MLTAFCLGFVLQTQTPTTTATPPAPIVIASGPARPVVVVLDGQAVTLLTTPLAGLSPTPPTPPAPPAPDPVPTPVQGKLWVSLIVQANDATQANLRTHDQVRGLAKPGEIELRTYTHDDPALLGVKLDPYISKYGLPLLIIQDQAGKVLEAGKVADVAAVTVAVRRYKP
jgi:hypothetical protein